PVDNKEKAILAETKIFKIAINQHGTEYKPDARIITDYVLTDICKNFTEKVVTVREQLRYHSNRVEKFDTEFKGATIISAAEYLKSKGYDEILIVGDNSVDSIDFQNLVKTEIDKLTPKTTIYQYTNGNFNLPVKSITEFCK
ncbi:hypothetical protein IKQ21_08715, partial [bacterium]|nr:hypothetical protein [bacterium]